MRKGILIVTTLAMIIGFTNCKKGSVNLIYDRKYIKQIKESRKDIAFFLSRNNVPGASFAVAKNGKIIYSEGIGLASKDLDVPANRNTKFRIGEVSELFTSTIYQLMIEDGVLDPDSTIQHYIPDYPEAGGNITLKQLAYHTSGIRVEDETEENWLGLNVSIQKGIDRFKDQPPVNVPDLFQERSMFNYNLLGAIMEKASGKKFSDLLKEYITDTLGFTNTTVDNPFQTIKGRTDFYDYNIISQVIDAISRDLRYSAPSKGILSNAEDLVKFGNAVFYTDFLPEKIKERLIEPVYLLDSFPAPMANAWILLESKGERIYGRKGTVTGGGAAILVVPHEKLVVAGTINLTSKLDEIPVFEIAEHFISETEETDNN